MAAMDFQKATAERYYFSIGKKEKDSKNPRLATTEEETVKVMNTVMAQGKEAVFEYNEGNHFGPLIDRIEKGLRGLLTL